MSTGMSVTATYEKRKKEKKPLKLETCTITVVEGIFVVDSSEHS